MCKLYDEIVNVARLISLSNTVADPRTMVVVRRNTLITSFTVLGSQWLLQVADGAILHLNEQFDWLGFIIFLLHFLIIITPFFINCVHFNLLCRRNIFLIFCQIYIYLLLTLLILCKWKFAHRWNSRVLASSICLRSVHYLQGRHRIARSHIIHHILSILHFDRVILFLGSRLCCGFWNFISSLLIIFQLVVVNFSICGGSGFDFSLYCFEGRGGGTSFIFSLLSLKYWGEVWNILTDAFNLLITTKWRCARIRSIGAWQYWLYSSSVLVIINWWINFQNPLIILLKLSIAKNILILLPVADEMI